MPRKDLKARDRRTGPGPDPIYKSTLISQIINKLIYGGKKATAERIIYGTNEEEVWKQIDKEFTEHPDLLQYQIIINQQSRQINLSIDIDGGNAGCLSARVRRGIPAIHIRPYHQ